LGPLIGGDRSSQTRFRNSCERCANGWSSFRSNGRISYPVNRAYDFLHGFLDFENAKRLIAYGVIPHPDDDFPARRPPHPRHVAPPAAAALEAPSW